MSSKAVAQGKTITGNLFVAAFVAGSCACVLAQGAAPAAEVGSGPATGDSSHGGGVVRTDPARPRSAYYVALTGDDGKPGTLANPFRTLHRAIQAANKGDTINVRVGPRYVPLSRVGTAGKSHDTSILRKGLLDVTLFGADPTGQEDSTQAIQNAVDAARDYQLAAFFPNRDNGQRGVYLVSSTINCFMAEQIAFDFDRMKPNVLIGSTQGAGRPMLKLSPTAPRFRDRANPVPLIRFWASPGSWLPQRGSTNPTECEDDVSFDQVFRGIDLDLGGNPGAYGIRHPGAQGCAVEDTTINAVGAYAGLGKFGVEGWAAYNVTVVGGKFAVYGVADGDQLSLYNGMGILIGCTFTGQETAVFCLSRTSVFPMVVAGFHIVEPRGVVLNEGNVCVGRGGISLIDGILEMQGGQIFRDDVPDNKFHVRYMRNVFVKGADAVADGWPIVHSLSWTHILEYSYTDGTGQNLVNGDCSTSGIRSKVEDANVTLPQLITDWVDKHRWKEATFPSFEDRDAVDVKDMGGHSAKGDGATDDTAALKYAIEHYDKIFLSKGIYLISETLTLKNRTQLFGIGTIFSQIRPHPSWHPSGETVVLTTADDKDARTLMAFMSVNTNAYLEVPAPPGAPADGFTPIQWRAGRNSLTRHLMAGPYADHWQPNPYRNYHRFRMKGNGGGRHFSPLARQMDQQVDESGYHGRRSLLIEGTSEPLYLYAFNGEALGDVGIEIKDSKNVHIYGFYHERCDVSIKVDHSVNILVVTSYKNTEVAAHRAGIEVSDSNPIAVVDYRSKLLLPNSVALREVFGGVSRTVDADNVVLFRRGDVDGVAQD